MSPSVLEDPELDSMLQKNFQTRYLTRLNSVLVEEMYSMLGYHWVQILGCTIRRPFKKIVNAALEGRIPFKVTPSSFLQDSNPQPLASRCPTTATKKLWVKILITFFVPLRRQKNCLFTQFYRSQREILN